MVYILSAFFITVLSVIGISAVKVVNSSKKMVDINSEVAERFRNYVSCEDCKYLIKREDAQVVKVSWSSVLYGTNSESYYCPKDKMPYDGVSNYYYSDGCNPQLKTTYFKSNVEVDKNGKLIK